MSTQVREIAVALRPGRVVHRCREALAARAVRWTLGSTLLIGVGTTLAVAIGTPPDEQTFADVSGPVQSLMSVTLPFSGALMMTVFPRPDRASHPTGRILAAATLAVVVALVGVALCAVATAVGSTTAADARWADAGAVAIGSVVVQLVAQLTGTGFGLLLRRPVLASAMTIVAPMGLWLTLTAVDVLRPAAAWLTPFASARMLLAGQMEPSDWLRWLVMVTIWALGLNLLGLRVARARGVDSADPGRAQC